MKVYNFKDHSVNVNVAVFSNSNGADEFHMVLIPITVADYQRQWNMLESAYSDVTKKLGLNQSSEVTLEVYFSDIANQVEFVNKTEFIRQRYGRQPVAVSLCQLPPLAAGAKFILKSYHIKSKIPIEKKALFKNYPSNAVKISHGKYKQFWLMNLLSSNLQDVFSSYQQTNTIFDQIHEAMSQNRLTLLNNAIRTWIYVRDIDNHYPGMVNSRREIFDKAGLNAKTHYIASTGIEGASAKPNGLVLVNALLYKNIQYSQVKSMHASGHMSSPGNYGVTFERGTELIFGDRRHMYISGTASIDQDGCTMYVGDIVKQTRRTMENIKALLEYSNSNLSDIAYLVVYLRDGADYPVAKDIVFDCVDKNTPVIFLRSSVCRPDWLVEIEGVAISEHKEKSLSAF